MLWDTYINNQNLLILEVVHLLDAIGYIAIKKDLQWLKWYPSIMDQFYKRVLVISHLDKNNGKIEPRLQNQRNILNKCKTAKQEQNNKAHWQWVR